MPTPLRILGRILFILAGILTIVTLTAYWVLVVRGVPLTFSAVKGRLETRAPAPALDGQEFSLPGFPTLSIGLDSPSSFTLHATHVEARRHVRLRPFGLYDKPSADPDSLRSALQGWVEAKAPGSSVARIELYPYFP